MFDRFRLGTVLFIGLAAIPFLGCGSSNEIDSIQVTPSTVAFGVVGLTAQLTATATINHGNHPSTTENVTSLATWTTSSADVATVSSTGLVTASGGAGTVQITASISGFTGIVSSSSNVTVTLTTGTGPTNSDVVSISVIPLTQVVASPMQTSQYIAIGTTSSGTTENVTNKAVWSSSDVAVGTIGAGNGLATAVGQGTTAITAIFTNPDATAVTGQATLTVTGGASEPFTALTISPAAQTLSASGQTGQFVAIATSGTTGLQEDVTNSPSLKWTSSVPTIASITTGLVAGNGAAQGVSAGNTTITAELTNPDHTVLTSTASVAVSATAAPEPLLSLTIIPSGISVGNLQDTGNFLAIGTFSTVPYVRDLTDTVTWLSDVPNVFPVSTNSNPPNPGAPGGIVTAYGVGTAVIIAEATSSDGTIQTATATFSCPEVLPTPTSLGTCYPGSQASGLLVTLTVYNEGLNTTNWLVTAPSATGTKDVLHCGPGWSADGNSGGSVCTASYPIGTTVTLTAPTQSGVAFGGWSYSCSSISPDPSTAGGPNTCTVKLGEGGNSNVTVGAIFN